MEIFAVKFFQNCLGRAVTSNKAFHYGANLICQVASQIGFQTIQCLFSAFERFVRQVSTVTIFVPSSNGSHQQRTVNTNAECSKIGDYVGRLRKTFSLISDSVVIPGYLV